MNIQYYFYNPYIKQPDDRLWHHVREFPSPGIPVWVRLDDGTERKAIRPDYVQTYKDDPNYRDPDTDEHITGVVEWAIY